MKQPSWESIASFAAVIRHGSLSAAARSLRLSQPTLRRHVEALEDSLGVVLFTRSTSGLLPTDAARQAATYAQTMGSMAEALVRSATAPADAAAGTVRIACSEIMATQILPFLLGSLLRQHPSLEIEIVASNSMTDMLRRDADLAIRMVRPTQAGLVARKVQTIQLGLFAARAYLDAFGEPATPAELYDGHRLVAEDRLDTTRAALAVLGLDKDALRFSFRSDNDAAMLAAIRAGLGVGVCQVPLAARYRLKRVLPDITASLETWIVMHEDLQAHTRTRLVFDHLVAAVDRYAGEIAGELAELGN